MATAPMLPLNDGRQIPQLGFGVFQIPEDATAAAVHTAFEAGYRSVDTAALYGNERAVGRAVVDSGLPREDVFVTTKVWNTDQGYDATLQAFDASMGRLGLEYVDLYLIHWPLPARGLYVETWRALEKLRAEGRTRSIGVSNFHPEHLDTLAAETDTVPAVNQVELHPHLPQAQLRQEHARRGIVTEAWSPLARGGLLNHPAVTAVARRHGRTPAQVVLRWSIELGNRVLPRSVRPERIRENAQLFDFALTDEDLTAFAALDNGGRIGPHPERFNS